MQKVGGSHIGCAFAFNALTGDHGIGGAVELSYRLGDSKGPIAKPTLFAFVDGSAAFDRKSATEQRRHHSLASVGAGTRFSIAGMAFSVEAGIPVAARGLDKSMHVFFSTYRTF
jgi:hemolysin activation/secretion protein